MSKGEHDSRSCDNYRKISKKFEYGNISACKYKSKSEDISKLLDAFVLQDGDTLVPMHGRNSNPNQSNKIRLFRESSKVDLKVDEMMEDFYQKPDQGHYDQDHHVHDHNVQDHNVQDQHVQDHHLQDHHDQGHHVQDNQVQDHNGQNHLEQVYHNQCHHDQGDYSVQSICSQDQVQKSPRNNEVEGTKELKSTSMIRSQISQLLKVHAEKNEKLIDENKGLKSQIANLNSENAHLTDKIEKLEAELKVYKEGHYHIYQYSMDIEGKIRDLKG